LVARRAQQANERCACLGVVVDDIQCACRFAHTCSPCAWRISEDSEGSPACVLARRASSRWCRRSAARLSQATISSRISRTSPAARPPAASSRCAAWALLRIADNGWRNSCARVSSLVTGIQPPCAAGTSVPRRERTSRSQKQIGQQLLLGDPLWTIARKVRRAHRSQYLLIDAEVTAEL